MFDLSQSKTGLKEICIYFNGAKELGKNVESYLRYL